MDEKIQILSEKIENRIAVLNNMMELIKVHQKILRIELKELELLTEGEKKDE